MNERRRTLTIKTERHVDGGGSVYWTAGTDPRYLEGSGPDEASAVSDLYYRLADIEADEEQEGTFHGDVVE